jgi:hypothetical protein
VFLDEEVNAHAAVVLNNIFGENADKLLLGVYRVDESDQVAAGESLMKIRPIEGGMDIKELLSSLDPARERSGFVESALVDVQRDAALTLDAAKRERLLLELYRNALRVATNWAVLETLKQFPSKELLMRFIEIWEKEQPNSLKIIKGIGKGVALPFTLLLKVPRKVRDMFWKEQRKVEEVSPEEVFQENLLTAVNDLHLKTMAADLSVLTTDTDRDGASMKKAVSDITSPCNNTTQTPPEIEALGKHRINIRVPRPDSLINDATVPARGIESQWKDILNTL